MPRIMIKCPKTGNSVPTGIAIDKISFESTVFTNNAFGPCMECGQTHTWSSTDAFLEITKEPGDDVENIDLLRITSFIGDLDQPCDFEGWLKKISKSETLRVQKSPTVFEGTAFADDKLVSLKWTPGRIDWTLSPNKAGGNKSVGTLDNIFEEFNLVISQMDELPGLPKSKRLAVATTIIVPVASQILANAVISKKIPGIPIVNNSEDFLFRINNPTIRGSAPATRINNIGTWQTVMTQAFQIQFKVPSPPGPGFIPGLPGPMIPGLPQRISQVNPVPLTPSGEPQLVVKIDIDINSDAHANLQADTKLQQEIIREMILNLVSIAKSPQLSPTPA